MRTLIIALYAVGVFVGCAQAEGYADFAVDAETLTSCEFLLGPQDTPEQTVMATPCGRSVLDYMLDNGLDRPEISAEVTRPRVACGAELLLANGETSATIAEVLADANFPDKCM